MDVDRLALRDSGMASFISLKFISMRINCIYLSMAVLYFVFFSLFYITSYGLVMKIIDLRAVRCRFKTQKGHWW